MERAQLIIAASSRPQPPCWLHGQHHVLLCYLNTSAKIPHESSETLLLLLPQTDTSSFVHCLHVYPSKAKGPA